MPSLNSTFIALEKIGRNPETKVMSWDVLLVLGK